MEKPSENSQQPNTFQWLRIAQEDLYEIALLVSSSEARMKDDVLTALEKAWNDFMIDFPQPAE